MKKTDNSDDLLTIIVPIYNTEKYLPQCIDSILAQTYQNIEVVLVNDGSTDNSGTICQNYALTDKRIQVINQNNQGSVIARMNGLNAAAGQYVAFVDSDDWIDCDLYDSLMKPFVKNGNTDVSVSPHTRNIEGIDCPQLSACPAVFWRSNEALRFMIENQWFNWTLCGKIYKAQLFQNLKLNNYRNPFGEDLEINWQIFRKITECAYIPKFGYHYRIHFDSMTHIYGNEHRFYMIDRLESVLAESYKSGLNFDCDIGMLCFRFTSSYLIQYMLQDKDANPNLIDKYQDKLQHFHEIVKDRLTVTQRRRYGYALMNPNKLRILHEKNINELIVTCRNFVQQHKKVYIYGAGAIAYDTAKILKQNGLPYEGFVTTISKHNLFCNKSLQSANEVVNRYGNNIGFILALNEKNKENVIKYLSSISTIPCIDAGKFDLRY